MAGMVEDAFTSRFAVARLEQDELPGKEDLVAFLSVNPGFDLSRTPLAPYLREHPDALAGVEDAQATARRVEAMSRLYKLTPRYLGVSTLLKDGLDSAYRVARLAQNVFRERYGTMLGGSLAATRIHRKAQSIQATAVNLLAEYAPVFQRVGCSVVPDAPVRELDDIPDWSSLFGSVSLCACEHCRSVQGPAAYLVDLLHFLGDRPALAQGSSVKDVLFARRPDLGEVQLSCENTNTPVPYVDLVNEALEDAVAPPPPFLPFVLDPALEADLNACAVSDALREAFQPPLGNEARISVGAAGRPWPAGEPWWTIDELAFSYTVRKRGGDIEVLSRSRQTRGSAAERAANAQYVNAGAYLRLGNSVYPWSLPFDSWAEEVRSYLAHLQVPRHHIMETVLPGGQLELLSVAALACERLGLTASEARIVVGLTTSEPAAPRPGAWNLWGFDTEVLSAEHSIPDPADRARRITTGTWIEALAGRVDAFLQRPT